MYIDIYNSTAGGDRSPSPSSRQNRHRRSEPHAHLSPTRRDASCATIRVVRTTSSFQRRRRETNFPTPPPGEAGGRVCVKRQRPRAMIHAHDGAPSHPHARELQPPETSNNSTPSSRHNRHRQSEPQADLSPPRRDVWCATIRAVRTPRNFSTSPAGDELCDSAGQPQHCYHTAPMPVQPSQVGGRAGD